MQYIALPDILRNEDKTFFETYLKIESIPTIIVIKKGDRTVIEYDEIMLEKNAKEKIKEFMDGGRNEKN